jgi:homospermidine synthase
VLVLGCGSVAQCLMPMMLDHFEWDPRTVTILESRDNRERVLGPISRGVTYERFEITRDNLHATLDARLGEGDLLVDLAWNIDLNELLQWCRDRGVAYLNTSVEVWDPYDDAATVPPLERTLYWRHMRLRRLLSAWPDNAGAPAVVEHGANPGLVSHFAKQALVEIAESCLKDGLVADASSLEVPLAEERYGELAMALGVRTIHIAERDSQVSREPKRPGEFVNTWSVDGFYEEGVAPAEMGWGTHERRLPPLAYRHAGEGPRNQICLAQMAHKTLVRSMVPSGPIVGMVIRHGESFTICDHLTVWDGAEAIYRPTVHYAYCPTDAAWASFIELEGAQYRYPEVQRIMGDDIIDGRDELGVLIMGHPLRSWWTGMLTSIEDARAVAPGQNATTVQVAASVIAAIEWLLTNPTGGVRVPDELPWREVLRVAEPYLGTLHSGPIDWDPLSSRADWFDQWSGRELDRDDPWQYENFVP